MCYDDGMNFSSLFTAAVDVLRATPATILTVAGENPAASAAAAVAVITLGVLAAREIRAILSMEA